MEVGFTRQRRNWLGSVGPAAGYAWDLAMDPETQRAVRNAARYTRRAIQAGRRWWSQRPPGARRSLGRKALPDQTHKRKREPEISQSNKTARVRRAAVPARMPGMFSGRIGKRRRKGRKSPYEFRGGSRHRELYGTLSSANCLWTGITSVQRGQIGFDVGIAMAIYLARQGLGRQVDSPDDAFGGDSNARFNLIIFRREQYTGDVSGLGPQDPGGSGTDVLYEPSENETVAQFATWFRDNVFTSPTFSAPGRRIATIFANRRDSGGDTHRAITIRDPSQLYIKAYNAVRFTMQNVTPADLEGGQELNAERIDANPIHGRSYRFSVPNPSVRSARSTDSTPLVDVNNDGVILSVDPTGDMATVSKPDIFRNCQSVGPISLAPGQIKVDTLVFKYDGNLNRLISGLGDHELATQPHRTFGKSIMYALQKRLRTGASQDIIINWQATFNSGCYVKKVVGPRFNRIVENPTAPTNPP